MATMIIMNNMVCLPRFERYFQAKQQSKWYASAPGVSNIFSRDRYVQLKCYIHFCDPHMRVPDRHDPEHDKLHKIRPIVSHLQNKFDAVYKCEKNISIDESMIPFKGRLKFKQRMPMKPVKYGIKLYEVCELRTGYCSQFSVYLGKQEGDDDNEGDLGKTGKVVADLTKAFQHKGYKLFIDNFYTSVPLLFYLSMNGIRACGTIRSNRKHFPKLALSQEAKRLKLKRGEFVSASYRDQLAILWKDRKEVYMLSTIHDPVNGTPVKRKFKAQGNQGFTEKEIPCPLAISDYNSSMGGVDLNDQLSSVRKDFKQLRWYFRVFLKFIMMATMNAYILEDKVKPHRNNNGRITWDLLSFKDELVFDLIGQVHAPRKSGRKRTRDEISKDRFDANRLVNVGDHLPGKGIGTNHTCTVCREKKKCWLDANKNKDPDECPLKVPKSTFVCLGCGEPPNQGQMYLCILRQKNCFKDYHEKVKFWL